LLREGLGRVGEAEVVEPKMPTTVDEVKELSMDELALVIALSCANEIRPVVDQGDDALRLEVERWEPNTRETLARALAEVGRPSATIRDPSDTLPRGLYSSAISGDPRLDVSVLEVGYPPPSPSRSRWGLLAGRPGRERQEPPGGGSHQPN
jgi:hypothetical protein